MSQVSIATDGKFKITFKPKNEVDATEIKIYGTTKDEKQKDIARKMKEITDTCLIEQDKKYYYEWCEEYGKDIYLCAGKIVSDKEFLGLFGWCKDKMKYKLKPEDYVLGSEHLKKVENKLRFIRENLLPNIAEIGNIYKDNANGGKELANKASDMATNICKTCKETYYKTYKCSQCKDVWYCSKICQKDDWENHKIICKPKT